jgi:hypothetical protein
MRHVMQARDKLERLSEDVPLERSVVIFEISGCLVHIIDMLHFFVVSASRF